MLAKRRAKAELQRSELQNEFVILVKPVKIWRDVCDYGLPRWPQGPVTLSVPIGCKPPTPHHLYSQDLAFIDHLVLAVVFNKLHLGTWRAKSSEQFIAGSSAIVQSLAEYRHFRLDCEYEIEYGYEFRISNHAVTFPEPSIWTLV